MSLQVSKQKWYQPALLISRRYGFKGEIARLNLTTRLTFLSQSHILSPFFLVLCVYLLWDCRHGLSLTAVLLTGLQVRALDAKAKNADNHWTSLPWRGIQPVRCLCGQKCTLLRRRKVDAKIGTKNVHDVRTELVMVGDSFELLRISKSLAKLGSRLVMWQGSELVSKAAMAATA